MNDKIYWTGNLNDDCTAIWKDMTLRTEMMDDNYWWWCVYDENDEIIDDSNDSDEVCINGKLARNKAEDVARTAFSKRDD